MEEAQRRQQWEREDRLSTALSKIEDQHHAALAQIEACYQRDKSELDARHDRALKELEENTRRAISTATLSNDPGEDAAVAQQILRVPRQERRDDCAICLTSLRGVAA